MDGLIDLTKNLILALMAMIAFIAIVMSVQLERLTTPLATKLAQLHQEHTDTVELGDRLGRIRDRYIALMSHVDRVDTAEFSAGEIETISLKAFSLSFTAAAAQSWLRQTPGILISLGLLGTFTGLTSGLTQITGALEKEATTADTISALSGIVSPMGAAFQTSLVGLLLSLIILIWTQAVGTRTCLERCEALLSSWLESVLPQHLGDKIMSPLRQSIKDLNSSLKELPDYVFLAVETAMKDAFSEKLGEVFSVHSNLASEAQIAVRQLGDISNAFRESGQDFVEAARSFRDSDFAATLQQSVQGLQSSQEQLSANAESLGSRLVDLRDDLLTTQAEWMLLSKTAEQELTSCRAAIQHIKEETTSLKLATESLQRGTQSLQACTEAATQATRILEDSCKESKRDRHKVLEIANTLQNQLKSGADVISTSLTDVKESLSHSQDDWKLVAQTAQLELESCRLATQQIQNEVSALQQSTKILEEGTHAMKKSTELVLQSNNQIVDACNESRQDRKMTLEIADAIRNRLSVDSSIAESCKTFASALEIAVSNWSDKIQQLDSLSADYINAVKITKLEDDRTFAERSKAMKESVEQLGAKLRSDLDSAIEKQSAFMARLQEPASTAYSISEKLLASLMELQTRLSQIQALNPTPGPSNNRMI